MDNRKRIKKLKIIYDKLNVMLEESDNIFDLKDKEENLLFELYDTKFEVSNVLKAKCKDLTKKELFETIVYLMSYPICRNRIETFCEKD